MDKICVQLEKLVKGKTEDLVKVENVNNKAKGEIKNEL